MLYRTHVKKEDRTPTKSDAPMPFTSSEQFQAVVITITGKFLGSVEGPRFKEMLDGYKDAGKRQMVIDLSNAEMMDSTGIGVLIGGLTSMRNVGGDIVLAGLKKRLRNIFLMTRLLGSVFTDYETVEEALASFETAE